MSPNHQNIFGVTGLHIFLAAFGLYLLLLVLSYIHHLLTRSRKQPQLPRSYNIHRRRFLSRCGNPRSGMDSGASSRPAYKRILQALPHLSLAILFIGSSVDFISDSRVKSYHKNKYANILELNTLVYEDDFPTTKKALELALKIDPECPFLNFLHGKYYLRAIRSIENDYRYGNSIIGYINKSIACFERSLAFSHKLGSSALQYGIATNLAILLYMKLKYADFSIFLHETETKNAIKEKADKYAVMTINDMHARSLIRSTLYFLYANYHEIDYKSRPSGFPINLHMAVGLYKENRKHHNLPQAPLPEKFDIGLYQVQTTISDNGTITHRKRLQDNWFANYMDATRIKVELLLHFTFDFYLLEYISSDQFPSLELIKAVCDLSSDIHMSNDLFEIQSHYTRLRNAILPINAKKIANYQQGRESTRLFEEANPTLTKNKYKYITTLDVERDLYSSSQTDINRSLLNFFDLLRQTTATEAEYYLAFAAIALRAGHVEMTLYFLYYLQNIFREYDLIMSPAPYLTQHDNHMATSGEYPINRYRTEANLMLAACYQMLSQSELAWKCYEEAGLSVSILPLDICRNFKKNLMDHEPVRGAEILKRLEERINDLATPVDLSSILDELLKDANLPPEKIFEF